MKIKLEPLGAGGNIRVEKTSDVLIVSGVSFDFSRIEEGGTLPATAIDCYWFENDVSRVGGELVLTLKFPHAVDADVSVRFPEDLHDVQDGLVSIPGQEPIEIEEQSVGAVDWGRLITAEQKAQDVAAQHLANVQNEVARLRATADAAIAPLQDAVDLDDATEAEAALLKLWKRFRVDLNRLPEQPGYPATITWPAIPA